MDLDLASPNDQCLKKVLFDLKGAHDNGLLLQIHPSSNVGHGVNRKLRFSHCSLSENGLLAISDSGGNIYVIDLEMQKYWQIPNRGTVSAISFPSIMKSKLFVCLNTGTVHIVHIETGKVTGVLLGHACPVREISFSYDGKHCLTSNSSEAIIWDTASCSQAHKLSLKDDMSLKKAAFMPVDGSIFACFRDDAMHVWKFGSFQCVKQILPDDWKTHHLKSVAFTKDGRGMAAGGSTPNIVIFCLDTWSIRKIIELPDSVQGVRHVEFVPQPFDGGSNKILAVVTNSSELFFIDVESSSFANDYRVVDKLVAHFCASPTGKYVANVIASGEVNVYVTQRIVCRERGSPAYAERVATTPKTPEAEGRKWCQRRQKWMEALDAVHNEIKEELSLKKLLPMLKQFGEYPESYRVVIWRTILQLPMNQEAFASLANKDCHESYANLDDKYPMVNRAMCNTLKRTLSTLSYWCPLFGQVTFLPEFVFPFVKVFHCDPFVCFESVATIIVNWCQNWFEFYPFPPINVLSIVENVLAHHDPDLLEYYMRNGITSCIYSCILMQTAFSEVLPKAEWLRLWDHILSNEPAFFVMVIVAYNTVCRNAIRNCESNEKVEAFFHAQNAIDIKLLISRSYQMVERTPSDIHPRQYLAPFSAMTKGDTYASYDAYPKLILEKSSTQLRDIQIEEEAILAEQRKAIAMKKELDRKLRKDKESEFREEVLTELDRKMRDVVIAEEARIAMQRKKLRNLRRELRLKELSVLEEMRDEMRRKRSRRKENEMEKLMKDIAARKAREDSEVEALEEDIRKYHASLVARKHQLAMDVELESNVDYADAVTEHLRRQDGKLKTELSDLQSEVTWSRCDRGAADISAKISNATDLLRRIESDVCRELASEDMDSRFVKNKNQIERLWRETKSLEEKFGRLLKDGSDAAKSRPTSPRPQESQKREDILSVISEEKDSDASEGSDADASSDGSVPSVVDVAGGDEVAAPKTTTYWEDADSDEEVRERRGSCEKAGTKLRSRFTECRHGGDAKVSTHRLRKELRALAGRSRRKRNGATGDAVNRFPDLSSDAADFQLSDSSGESRNSVLVMALSERRRLVDRAKRRHTEI